MILKLNDDEVETLKAVLDHLQSKLAHNSVSTRVPWSNQINVVNDLLYRLQAPRTLHGLECITNVPCDCGAG